ncbi:hypothetical protein B0H66DRAFT_555698 [Apodospora peruviana]|uniref:Uncharacterized protein n=1 Tax=Apodospora peruviana TaxID=516989 RepID=A0AAE0IDG5_9PEZI|nr:hypothetical protein B0H66DRAFT_555698 [Apodospora peruviana]
MQAPQHPQRQPLQHQQDPQPQQSTYFHHWQPPRSHANFRMDELDPDGEIEAARQEEAERLRRENHDQESAPLQGQTRMPGTGTGTNPRRRGVAVRRYDDDGDDEIQVARQEAERLQREEYGHEDALLQVAASRAMAHGLDSNNFDLGDGFSDPYSEEERVLEDERREQEEWYLAEEAEHVREQELWEEQRVEDELREMEEREIAETYSSSEGSDEDEDDEDDSDRDGSVESDDE